MTVGHRRLSQALEELGFEVTIESRFGPYLTDCFVQELGIAFEYDGPIHGLLKKKDARRDKELINDYGLRKVVHIKDVSNTQRLTEEILTAIE
mgnify:CR=1 FL=1